MFPGRVSRRSLGRGDGPLLLLSETCELTLVWGARHLANSHPSAGLCGTENGALQQLRRRGEPPPRAVRRPSHPRGGEAAPHSCTSRSRHPMGGAGARGSHIHCPLSSHLRGSSVESRAKVGRGDTREGAPGPFLSLIEAVLGTSGRTVMGAPAS